MDFINKFPNESERDRIEVVNKYTKLFDLKQRAVLGLHDIIEKQYKKNRDLVYLSHAIPSRVSEFYGDFVQGDEERLTISPPNDDAKLADFFDKIIFENDLIEKVYDMGVEQSEYGFFVLHTWIDDKKVPHIDLVPQDQWFPQNDGSVIIATYKKDPADPYNQYLVLTQHYTQKEKSVEIERKAFRAKSNGVVQEEISLEKMASVLGRKEIKEKDTLNIDTLPFVQVNNGRADRSGFGKSDYYDIFPQLAELNERTTHVSTQLLKNLDSKIVIPETNNLFDEDGNIKNFDYYIIDDNTKVEPKYVANSNPLIDATMEHILFQLKVISWVTAVPMFSLLKGGMPERVEALRMQLFDAIRKTNTKRSKIKRGLKDILHISAKLMGVKMEDDPIIEMSSVLPVDEVSIAEAENTKVQGGFSSRKSAMKRVEGYSDEEAEAELDQIRQEEKVAGVDTENPPQL